MPHPRHLQQIGVDGLFDGLDPQLLAEVVRAQQAEVVVRVDVIQRQDQVDQRLAAAPPDTLQRGLRMLRGHGFVLYSFTLRYISVLPLPSLALQFQGVQNAWLQKVQRLKSAP